MVFGRQKYKNKFSAALSKFNTLVSVAFDKSKALSALKKSFITLIPVFVAGAFLTTFLNLPITGYQTWLESFAGGAFLQFLQYVSGGTSGILSLLVTFTLGYNYAKLIDPKSHQLHILSAVTALSCYIASFGVFIAQSEAYDLSSYANYVKDIFSSTGVFIGILTALVSTRMFMLLAQIFAKSKQYTSGSDEASGISMRAVFPYILCIAAFAAFNVLLCRLFDVSNPNELIQNVLISVFSKASGTYTSGLLYVFVLHIMYFFGINGAHVLSPIADQLFSSGGGSVYSQSFLNIYATMGGGGLFAGLVLAAIIFSKKQSTRRIAFTSSVPVAFNINETMLFGFPVVANPILFIPFMLAPILSYSVASLVTLWGWVPAASTEVVQTVPILWSGYAATGSVGGLILQLIFTVFSTLLYWPFIKAAENHARAKHDHVMQIMTDIVKADKKYGLSTPLLSRTDEVGLLAKHIASKLIEAMENEEIELFYQPQFDEKTQIFGTEALLRWEYNDSFVYPPLVLRIAEEAESMFLLSQYIRRRAIRDCKRIIDNLGPDIVVSINASAKEIDRKEFVTETLAMLEEGRVPPSCFGIEITEGSMTVNINTAVALTKLHNRGINLFIDDFNISNSALQYLKSSIFEYVKIEGNLIKDSVQDPDSSGMVSSIITLGDTLSYDSIAKFVETEETRDYLYKLNCNHYQGFLYSPAIPLDDFIRFAKNYPIAPRKGA